MRSQTPLRFLLLILALAILTYCFALDSRFASLRPQARPKDLTPPAPAPDALVAEEANTTPSASAAS